MKTVGHRLRGRVAVRPRHHGAASFPDAPIRSTDNSGQHQLPGTSVNAVAARLGFRRGTAPAPVTPCPRRSPSSETGGIFPLARDSGLGKNQRSLGSGLSRPAHAQRSGRAARLHRRADLRGRRTRRVRDPHLHRHRRGGRWQRKPPVSTRRSYPSSPSVVPSRASSSAEESDYAPHGSVAVRVSARGYPGTFSCTTRTPAALRPNSIQTMARRPKHRGGRSCSSTRPSCTRARSPKS